MEVGLDVLLLVQHVVKVYYTSYNKVHCNCKRYFLQDRSQCQVMQYMLKKVIYMPFNWIRCLIVNIQCSSTKQLLLALHNSSITKLVIAIYGMKMQLTELYHFHNIMTNEDTPQRKIDIGRKYFTDVIPTFYSQTGTTYSMFWKAGRGDGSIQKLITSDGSSSVSLCVYPKILHVLKALYKSTMLNPPTILAMRRRKNQLSTKSCGS